MVCEYGGCGYVVVGKGSSLELCYGVFLGGGEEWWLWYDAAADLGGSYSKEQAWREFFMGGALCLGWPRPRMLCGVRVRFKYWSMVHPYES